MSGVGKVDISKIKRGDKVSLVPMEVHSVEGNRIYLHHEKSFFCLNTDYIADHHPAPRKFRVGDKVRHEGFVGIVCATDGVRALIGLPNFDSGVVPVSDLTLVEAGQ